MRASSVLRASYQSGLARLIASGRSPHWMKVKNPKAPAVRREAERRLEPARTMGAWWKLIHRSSLLPHHRVLVQ